MAGPLTGIKVLDFTRFQQGPYATALLVDLGADVLKVEPREGEGGRQSEKEGGFSAYFEAYNRGKRDMTLDIRTPEGKEIVRRLVPHMDVVVENFRPGVMDRLGLGYEALRALNPRLVYGAASAFGPRGPLSERPGYDHIAQAVSGLMIEQAGGPGRGDPVPALPGAADQIGAMTLALGIVAALWQRERSGAGQKVEASLLGSMMSFQGRQITRFLHTGKQGRARFRRSPVYAHYRAQDGWVAIAAQDPKRWAALCRALERPELTDDPRFAGPWDRHANAEALEAELEQVFATRTVREWLDRLVAADVPCGAVNSYQALVDEGELAAQLQANGYLTTVETPNYGALRTHGIPWHFSATPAGPVGHAPELGQQTEDVLLDLGYTWEDIERFKAGNII